MIFQACLGFEDRCMVRVERTYRRHPVGRTLAGLGQRLSIRLTAFLGEVEHNFVYCEGVHGMNTFEMGSQADRSIKDGCMSGVQRTRGLDYIL